MKYIQIKGSDTKVVSEDLTLLVDLDKVQCFHFDQVDTNLYLLSIYFENRTLLLYVTLDTLNWLKALLTKTK